MLSDIKILLFHLPAFAIVIGDYGDGSVAHEEPVEKTKKLSRFGVVPQDHATEKHGMSLTVTDDYDGLSIKLLRYPVFHSCLSGQELTVGLVRGVKFGCEVGSTNYFPSPALVIEIKLIVDTLAVYNSPNFSKIFDNIGE